MDFSLIIFLIIAWTVISKVKGGHASLSKAVQNSDYAKDIFAKAQTKVKDAAARTAQPEFEVSPELRPGYRKKSSDDFASPWGDMTPTQRGRERARQAKSYPGENQQNLQQRLEAAKAINAVRATKNYKQGSFKQGSERKVKRQRVGRGTDFGLSSRHAPNKDQNRQRRDDWGQRGGGEIITTKSLIVLLALGTIVIYVLSQVSPSDLGL